MTSRARRRRTVAAAYALMAPAILLVVVVIAYPVAWEVWASLSDLSSSSTGAPAFVGLANFRRMAGAPEFWRALATTGVYFALTAVAKLGLGLALALLLARPSRGRRLAFLAVFLPWAYPGAVAVIAWYWMLNPPITTSYSAFLGSVKHAVDLIFGGGAYAFASVALFNVWRGSSFTAVFLLAGLNAIPTELFEYARMEASTG